jgi:hypothetical protein
MVGSTELRGDNIVYSTPSAESRSADSETVEDGKNDYHKRPLLRIQSDRKVKQPTLKYLLMVAIHYNYRRSIKHTYRCGYTRAHAGHVML